MSIGKIIDNINDSIKSIEEKIATSKFLIKHRKIAWEIGDYSETSNNISSIAGRFAINLAKFGKLTTGQGSERNALRHVIWQAIITKKFGKDIAKEAGDAHEGDKTPSDLALRSSGNEQTNRTYLARTLESADSIADLENNIIGRDIGAHANPSTLNEEIAKKAVDTFYREGLWMVEKEGSLYKVAKKKLSQEKYQVCMQLKLNSLGWLHKKT